MRKTFDDVVYYVDEDTEARSSSWTMELYDGSRWWLSGVKGYVWLRYVDPEDGTRESVGMDGNLDDEAERERIFMALLHRHPEAKLYEGDDVMRLVTSLRPIIRLLDSDMPGVRDKLAEVRRNLQAFEGRWE